MDVNKYSDWLKIDLHIHTDCSRKTKDNDYKGDFSVDTLKTKLKENKVEIFSLTDHNIINIDTYKKYYGNYNKDEDPLLLVGVELDLLVKTDESEKTYHSLLIFNYSTYEKATEISKKLEDNYSENKIAIKNRILTIDEIIELFQEDDFFFIPHAGNTKSIVSGYRENIEDAQKMVLLMQSPLEKVKAKVRQKYNDGFNKVLVDAFKSKEDIAYIEFSDNHNIEKYPCAHKGEDSKIHKFYYIKGGKNFETLRLAFIDPQSRIKSPEKYGKINHSINFIEKLKITNDSFLKNNEITFSPHLNVIIGGRSSGKSLLLNLLGQKIDKIPIDDKYKIEMEHVSIKAKRDDGFQSATSLSDELIYLNQGDIVRYFEEKKLNELAKKSDKQEDYDATLEKFKEHKAKLEEKIDTFILSYKQAYEVGEVKQFILHNSIIRNILNTNYILKFEKDQLIEDFDISEKITDSEMLLEDLREKTSKLKDMEILNFSDSEKQQIDAFEQMIKDKVKLLKEKETVNRKTINFIESVGHLINDKNQNLNTEARQKEEANTNLTQLKNNISTKFIKLVQMKNRCFELELFEYAKKENIKVNAEKYNS